MTSQRPSMTSQQPSSANALPTTTHRTFLAQIQGTTYGQSFSGSETDVSTSTENLSPEERYALEHTQRQEPQGQENVSTMANTPHYANTSNAPATNVTTAMRANESNASICSSTNTLIIHHNVSDEPWQHRWYPGGYSTPMAGRKPSSGAPPGQEGTPYTSQMQHKLESLNFNSSGLMPSTLMNTSLLDSSMLAQKSTTPSYLSQSNILSSTDLPDIPSSYLDQSEVLKHLLGREGKGGNSDASASSSNSGINLMTESLGSRDLSQMPLNYNPLDTTVNYDVLNLPPPPAYPGWRLVDSNKRAMQELELLKHNMDKINLSKSQPDLTRLANAKEATSPTELLSQRVVSGQTDIDTTDGHLQEMADMLIQENRALKREVDMYHTKVNKLQRFEMEIIKVHEAHESLVKISERREQLERLARHKLQAEVKRLTELNADLKDQVDVLSTQIAHRAIAPDSSDSLRKELNKRDVFIAQLVSQNKELIAAKERQEIELTAQRQTLNEQRTHIDILDSALTNAQANVVKLEEELRKKQNLVEQAGQLKRLLVSLQLAADRREQSEKNLRYRLEKEIEQLRLGVRQEEPASKLSDLRRELREKEEKIMVLEGEVTKWEQRYLQESAMRQLAIDAVSLPKDAKIAALEKTSQESERRIAQAKSEKLRHMDEIHNMNKKQTEYEARNRELESHVAERDAMIRVLQKRAEEKEAMYQKALMRNSIATTKSLDVRSGSSNSLVHSSQASTVHSHTSSGVGGAAGGSTPSTPRRDEELGQESQATGGGGVGRNRLRDHVAEKLRAESCSKLRRSPVSCRDIEPHSRSSDDLLVDNEDAKSKLRVVCFPGLAHSGTAAGEGQVPQPLLECVDSSLAPPPPLPRRPASDMPYLSLGLESPAAMRPYSDLPMYTCPPYDPDTLPPYDPDPLPSYPDPLPSYPDPLPSYPDPLPSYPIERVGSPPLYYPLERVGSAPSYPLERVGNTTSYPLERVSSAPSYPLERVSSTPLPPPCDFSSLVPPPPVQISPEPPSLQSLGIVPAVQQPPRGNPPPYHGRHEVLQHARGAQLPSPVDQSSAAASNTQQGPGGGPGGPPNNEMGPKMSPSAPNLSTEMPMPRPAMCRNLHHPTVACRKCNSVRSSNRQNAAILVRRANSSAGPSHRNSAPLTPCQTTVTNDDAPSILARLRREWELENAQMAADNSQVQQLSAQVMQQPLVASDNQAAANSSIKPQEQKVQQKQKKSSTSTAQTSNTHRQQENPHNDLNKHYQQEVQASQGKAFDQPVQAYASVHNTRPPDYTSALQSPKSPPPPPIQGPNHLKPCSTGTRPHSLPENSSLCKSIVSSCNITETNNTMTYSVNNKNANQVNKNNDINQSNNNQEEKIELIILEDTDQLKIPPNSTDITTSIQDVI